MTSQQHLVWLQQQILTLQLHAWEKFHPRGTLKHFHCLCEVHDVNGVRLLFIQGFVWKWNFLILSSSYWMQVSSFWEQNACTLWCCHCSHLEIFWWLVWQVTTCLCGRSLHINGAVCIGLKVNKCVCLWCKSNLCWPVFIQIATDSYTPQKGWINFYLLWVVYAIFGMLG